MQHCVSLYLLLQSETWPAETSSDEFLVLKGAIGEKKIRLY